MLGLITSVRITCGKSVELHRSTVSMKFYHLSRNLNYKTKPKRKELQGDVQGDKKFIYEL